MVKCHDAGQALHLALEQASPKPSVEPPGPASKERHSKALLPQSRAAPEDQKGLNYQDKLIHLHSPGLPATSCLTQLDGCPSKTLLWNVKWSFALIKFGQCSHYYYQMISNAFLVSSVKCCFSSMLKFAGCAVVGRTRGSALCCFILGIPHSQELRELQAERVGLWVAAYILFLKPSQQID